MRQKIKHGDKLIAAVLRFFKQPVLPPLSSFARTQMHIRFEKMPALFVRIEWLVEIRV